MVTTGGRDFELVRGIGRLQLVFDRAFLDEHGGVAQLFDHQHRGVLIDGLVDGGHHAHVHHHLDDFVGLHGHALRQLADRDGLADLHIALDRRGRTLEAVLARDIDLRRTTARPASRVVCFFFLKRALASLETCSSARCGRRRLPPRLAARGGLLARRLFGGALLCLRSTSRAADFAMRELRLGERELLHPRADALLLRLTLRRSFALRFASQLRRAASSRPRASRLLRFAARCLLAARSFF